MILDYGPDSTADTEQAKRDLRKFGFCLIKDAITGDFFTESKNRLLEQAAAEEEMGLSFRDGGPDQEIKMKDDRICLLYTSPSPRDATLSRMPSSA